MLGLSVTHPPGSRGRCPSRGTTVTQDLPPHVRIGRSGSSLVRATRAVGSGPVPFPTAPAGVFRMCAGCVRVVGRVVSHSGVEGVRVGPCVCFREWGYFPCVRLVASSRGVCGVGLYVPGVAFLGMCCVMLCYVLVACWLRVRGWDCGSGGRRLESAAVGLTSWLDRVGTSSAVGPLWSRLRCGCGGCLVAEAQLPVLVAGALDQKVRATRGPNLGICDEADRLS